MLNLFKKQHQLTNSILGLAIGDALGVPVEFMSRSEIKKHPVKRMLAYGTHHQPKGTWSDDTSLTMCLVESLINGYSLTDISKKFIKWYRFGYWTPHGGVFDIGNQTRISIEHLEQLLKEENCKELTLLKYETNENTNGNGSLMRILPLYAYIKNFDNSKQFEIIRDVSALTHGHIRSAIACFIYLKFCHFLFSEKDKFKAYSLMQNEVSTFFKEHEISQIETKLFDRILSHEIYNYNEDSIKSSGYVLDTLEASLWCFLTTSSFEACVLKAVNLGDDTDTTGAISGSLAGLYYGYKSFPKAYINDLVAFKEIKTKADELSKRYL